MESEKRPAPVILGPVDDLDGVNKGHQNGRQTITTEDEGQDKENLDNWEAQISEIINWVRKWGGVIKKGGRRGR